MTIATVANIMMLGKRKRETQVVSKRNQEIGEQESNATPTIDSSDIFRRHFEASFAPLPEQRVSEGVDDSKEDVEFSEQESGVSEWSGLSESDSDLPVVEVVDHAIAESGIDDEIHRARQKAFMVRLSRFAQPCW